MNKGELRYLIKGELKKIRDEVGEINLLISGGIDSGILAALSKPDRLFTVRLPFGPMHDEFKDVLKIVRHLGIEDRLIVIDLDISEFDDVMNVAVRVIGRPIPHYNIFPLFCLFRKIHEIGITDVVCGDGPDESMCGYTRHLIMSYLYSVRNFPAFEYYQGMVNEILEEPAKTYANLIGKDTRFVRELMNGRSLLDGMCFTDMELMRPDMDDMSNKLAQHFGIKIRRPYQDSSVIDEAMFTLPAEQKIGDIEYGKFLLRMIAEELLPIDIAWKKQKIGGPLIPVNKIKGWDLPPFDKSRYLEYQWEILNG